MDLSDLSYPVVAPSVLSADFSNLQQELDRAVASGADWIHVDPMDGHFVPNLTVGPLIVEAIRRNTDRPLDVHLMLENPSEYVGAFLEAGADLVTFHLETMFPSSERERVEAGYQLKENPSGVDRAQDNARELIRRIHEQGGKAGIALNPPTPATLLEGLLPQLDLVLVMTVWPGFGGQSFMEGPLEKINTLRTFREGTRPVIEVDGGISPETIALPAETGAEVFVAGSATFGADDMKDAISTMRVHARQGYSAAEGNSL